MMRVLLTGGTGFIGRELGKYLVRDGHEVFVVTRDKSSAKKKIAYPCRLMEYDLESGKGNWWPIIDFDAVVHLAGEGIAEHRWTERVKKGLVSSRVQATENLRRCLASSKSPPKIWIQASAVGFYGDRGEQVLTEEASVGEGFLSELCLHWERASQGAATRVVQLRFGMVLGLSGGALPKMLPIFREGLAGPLAGGQQWMSWIHLQDLCRMIMWSLHNEKVHGAYNAVAPHPIRNQKFTQVLSQQLHRKALLPVPRAALHIAMGEMKEIVLASQRVTPVRALDNGFKFEFSSVESALENLLDDRQQGDEERVDEYWVAADPSEVSRFLKKASDLKQAKPDNHQIRQWRHRSEIKSLAKGALVRETVHYRLPLGRLGRLAIGWKQRSNIQKWLDHRRDIITGKFA